MTWARLSHTVIHVHTHICVYLQKKGTINPRYVGVYLCLRVFVFNLICSLTMSSCFISDSSIAALILVWKFMTDWFRYVSCFSRDFSKSFTVSRNFWASSLQSLSSLCILQCHTQQIHTHTQTQKQHWHSQNKRCKISRYSLNFDIPNSRHSTHT